MLILNRISFIRRSLNHFPKFTIRNRKIENFPYVFGGLEKKPVANHQEQQLNKRMIQQIFPPHFHKGLQMAYQSVLEAFEERDIDFLKSVCEKRLTKHLKIPSNLKLINTDQHIGVKIKKIKFCLGMPVDRSQYPEQVIQYLFEQFSFIEFYFGESLTDMDGLLLQNIMLEVEFQSSAKLIKEQQIQQNAQGQQQYTEIESQQNSGPEIHLFQFEMEKRIPMRSFIWQLFKQMIIRNKLIFFNSWTEGTRGDSWTISDIDSNLKGNIPSKIIVKKKSEK